MQYPCIGLYTYDHEEDQLGLIYAQQTCEHEHVYFRENNIRPLVYQTDWLAIDEIQVLHGMGIL